ncbi:MAG: Indole-3-glycerol phosphate synthase TrpC [Candidatus Methanohalarchaeum thermophilum]|uniref:indole-3-glycerol-phosphate synthase n=1 Tax=Methanohalarchaeum thermophilum TaxID=1903181 RepID=A0A1Q6DSA8_METT1|nr:MAG: Indole-3-glycerol phosphate synthase TrpC [Candidatus Methanohalarchaeum thermophilum]
MLKEILVKKKAQEDLSNEPKLIKNKYKSNSLKKALEKRENALIGEIKFKSPSEGKIIEEELENLVRKMEKLNSLSILTESNYFNGSIDYLDRVKEIYKKPVLRKDFIYDKRQLYQTKRHKADAVLLITSILGEKLTEFVQLSNKLKLDPLVEVKTKKELDLALKTKTKLIGINNRNLETLGINLERTKKLSQYIPEEITTVSESGIKDIKDIKELEDYCDAFLIGTAFMKSNNLEKKVDKFLCA